VLRYAITDRLRFPGDESARHTALLRQARSWSDAGPDLVQLREKDLDAGALATLARQMLAVLRARSPAPKLLIHSRADIAIATRADGVHLTSAQGSLTPAQVRYLYASANLPAPIVSVSCHSLAEVARAATGGPVAAATLILFGPVFEKRIGNDLIALGTGLDLLRAACAAADPTPVLALGGVSSTNAEACLAAGAAGIAAIRLFL